MRKHLILKKEKSKKQKYPIKMYAAITALALGVVILTNPEIAFAAGAGAGAGSFTAPVTNMKNIIVTVAQAIGGVILAYGAVKFAFAFKNQDNQSEHSAIYTVVAGAILLGAGTLIQMLGG